jgi:hypothetical protein
LITGQAADYQFKLAIKGLDIYQELLLKRITLKTAVEPHKSRSPVEGLNGIYVVHPTGECEETRSCFDWALKKQLS